MRSGDQVTCINLPLPCSIQYRVILCHVITESTLLQGWLFILSKDTRAIVGATHVSKLWLWFTFLRFCYGNISWWIHVGCRSLHLYFIIIISKGAIIQLSLYRRSTLMEVRILHWMLLHFSDVIMGAIASQITSLTIVYSTVYSDADQRKHQSSASLAFVWGIHRGSVNSPHKRPVTRKMFPFDEVIKYCCLILPLDKDYVLNRIVHWHVCVMLACLRPRKYAVII